jgi:MFS family permease
VSRSSGILARPYLAASIAIYTTVALVAFEGTAVAAALPQVAGDLGRLDLLPWVITAYLFASGVATVMAGPAIDALGTRAVFRLAVLVFSLAGFSVGLSPNIPAMIGIRLIQGAGGGMIVAVGLAAVSLVYPSELTGRAFAANSTVWGVMGAAAPLIASVILAVASWRWIFFVNLPLGLASVVAGWKVMPGPRSEATPGRADLIGLGLVAVFTIATLLAVDDLGPGSAGWAIAAIAAIVVYRRHARRVDAPLIRPEHVFHQPYSTIGLTVALMITAAFATSAFVTIYASAGKGAGTALTAWSVFFFTIGWTLGANVSSVFLRRNAESGVMVLGAWATIGGLVATTSSAWLDLHLAGVLGGLAVTGTGIGMLTNAALTLLRAVTPDAQIGRAAAAHQFVRNQGFTLGSALGGTVLLFVIARKLGAIEPVQQLLSGDTSAIDPSAAGAVRSGYATAATVALILSTLALIPLVQLRRHLATARAEANSRRTGDAAAG